METTHLQEYVSVADCGSFTAAARDLHLTQSALSKHIAALEREFDAELFVRDRSGIRLTEAGKTLYVQAVRIVRTLGKTRALVRAAQDGMVRQSDMMVSGDVLMRDTALRCKCRLVATRCGLDEQEVGALALYLEERGFEAIQAELGVTRDNLAETLGRVYRKLGVGDKQAALDFVHSVSE